MSATIEIADLQQRLSEALKIVSAGGEVILTEGSVPRMRLSPLGRTPGKRVPGMHPGVAVIADDFDAPLPDEFWEGRE